MTLKKFFLTLFIAIISATSFANANIKPKAFDAGDTICFAGDSITHHGFYPKHIALYYITRFPHTKMTFRNSGSEGHSANTTLQRVKYDLRPDKHTVFTLMLGMNDCRAGTIMELKGEKKKAKHAENLEKYKRQMAELSEILVDDSKKLILLSSSIYDGESDIKKPVRVGINGEILPKEKDIKTPERNMILKDYVDAILAYAKSNSIQNADIWSYTNAINKEIHKTDKSISAIGEDRVHPFNFGGFVIANGFLNAMQESSVVSEVIIDASNTKVIKLENAKVSALAKNSAGNISFELLENSLPYPLTEQTQPADKFTKFTQKFNQQILSVKNLSSANYKLIIDGNAVGEYSAQELSKGVNLALYKNTPQYVQALKVEKLVEEWRANMHKFRNCMNTEFAYKLNTANREACRLRLTRVLEDKKSSYYAIKRSKDYLIEGEKRDEFFNNAQAAISEAYKVAKPRSHTYRLEKISK